MRWISILRFRVWVYKNRSAHTNWTQVDWQVCFSWIKNNWYWRMCSGPSWSGDLRKCLANSATEDRYSRMVVGEYWRIWRSSSIRCRSGVTAKLLSLVTTSQIASRARLLQSPDHFTIRTAGGLVVLAET